MLPAATTATAQPLLLLLLLLGVGQKDLTNVTNCLPCLWILVRDIIGGWGMAGEMAQWVGTLAALTEVQVQFLAPSW